MTVYGPYRNRQGRQHVIHYQDGKRKTQSYPRYLMEQHLGRKLEQWEHVDHINGDPSDDRIENFQILTQQENNQKRVVEQGLEAKLLQFQCPVCYTQFEILERVYRRNQLKLSKEGPYCSKSCCGKMHN